MEKQSSRLAGIGKAIFSCFLIVSMVTALSAQEALEKSPDKSLATPQVPFNKQAQTRPISNSKITLKLTFDGTPFEVTQHEGAIIRIERNGSVYGLVPYLAGGRVQIKAFKMFAVTDGKELIGESISDLRDFEISIEDAPVIEPESGAKIKLLRVEKAHITKLIMDHPQPMLLDACCVTCGGTTVCGCGVGSDCGSCCVRGCPNCT